MSLLYNFGASPLLGVSAFGNGLSGNRPTRHAGGDYGFSSSSLNFLSFSAPIENLTISTEQCGISVGCFRVPANCTSSENCDALVTYKYNATANAIDFVLTSTNAYIGFGHVAEDNVQRMVS